MKNEESSANKLLSESVSKLLKLKGISGRQFPQLALTSQSENDFSIMSNLVQVQTEFTKLPLYEQSASLN